MKNLTFVSINTFLILLFVSALSLAADVNTDINTTAETNQGVTIDTRYYYTLHNSKYDEKYALESSAPGSFARLTKLKKSTTAGQLWRFTPRGNGYYQLSSQFTGESYGLESDGPGVGCSMRKGMYSGQKWKLIDLGGGWYKLVSEFTENGHNDAYALEGGSANKKCLMTEWKAQSGQYWKLKRRMPVQLQEEVPDVSGGSEGPLNQSTIVNTKGEVNLIFMFVDFSDSKGTKSKNNKWFDETFNKLTGNKTDLQNFYSNESYGQLSLQYQVIKEWKRMPKKLSYYVPGPGSGGWKWADYVKDAAALIPSSNYDENTVLVIVPPEKSAFLKGAGAHGVKIGKLRKQITIGTLAFEKDANFKTMAHEVGHCLGLPDLYPFKKPLIHQVGPWDIMADMILSAGFLGWHKKLFGWITPERSTYLRKGGWNGTIAPFSSKYGVSMVVIPDKKSDANNPDKVWVVQVTPPTLNKKGNVDSPNGKGVLIYTVQSKVTGDNKFIQIAPKKPVTNTSSSSADLVKNAPYLVGDSFNVPGAPMTVRVVGKVGDSFYIDIQPK
ncbi:MAG: hypothetical protein AAF502_11355 [Bacteroidota bacterium]